jgi:class 3 adenylate cyclase
MRPCAQDCDGRVFDTVLQGTRRYTEQRGMLTRLPLLLLVAASALGHTDPDFFTVLKPNPPPTGTPGDPCRPEAFDICAAHVFGTAPQRRCYANLADPATNPPCDMQLECSPGDVLAFRRCLRYASGCLPPTEAPCFAWIGCLNMTASCDLSLACSALQVTHTVLAMPSMHLGDKLDALPPNTSVTTLSVDAAAGSAGYVEAARAVLALFEFDLAVFIDGLYDVVGGEFPEQRKLAIYGGATSHPNSFVATVNLASLGFIAGYDVSSHSTTGHVAFVANNFQAQSRQVFEGFVLGVRSVCPQCKPHLYTDGIEDWHSNIDAAAFVNAGDWSDVSNYSLAFELPGFDLQFRTANVTIETSTFVMPVVNRLLEQFQPGSEVVDFSLPGGCTYTRAAAVPADDEFVLAFERLTQTVNLDLNPEDPVEKAPPIWSGGFEIRGLSQVVAQQASSSSNARFSHVGDGVFAALSIESSDIRIFTASSLLDRNATVYDKPSPRAEAAVAFRRSVYTIIEAYVVFGRDPETGQRLGDVWRADSGVGDFHHYHWLRVYDLSDALREDPAQVLPLERYGHTVSIVGNSMYVFGGVTRDVVEGAIATNELYCLDLATYRWKELRLPQIEGRAFHRSATVYDPTQPTTEYEAAGVRDTQLLVVGFGTAWKSNSPVVQVIGLTTLRTATLDLPKHPNGTSMIQNGPDSRICMTAVGSALYVSEAFKLFSTGTSYAVRLCKYSTALGGGWEGCRDLIAKFRTSDLENCAGVAEDSANVLFYFATSAPPVTVTDPNVVCDGSQNVVPTKGGWSCAPCPPESYAVNSVCIPCDDYDPDEALNSLASGICANRPRSVASTIVGICVGVALALGAAAGAVYYRSRRDMKSTQSAEELVEDVARAVASGYLVPVEHLYDLRRPNRMQRSVVNILKLFDVYAQFVPGWMFRGNRTSSDLLDAPAKLKPTSRTAASPLSGASPDPRDIDSLVKLTAESQSGAPRLQMRDGGSTWGGAKAAELLYRPRFADDAIYTADVTVLCIQVQIDLGDPRAAQQLDRILRIIVNTVDDGDGLVQSMWGDQIIATFNGLMVNSQHVRDAAASVCIMSESLDAIGTRCTFGLARGCANVGVATGICGQRSVLVGDVLERARELTVANRVLQTQILCDWALGKHLGTTFAVQLLGYWDRSVRVKYLFAELLGMAQNDDAAVRVQAAFEESKGRDRMSVRVCLKDYTAANRLMVAIDKGDDRRRDLLLQQCRLNREIPENRIRKMMECGLPHYNQGSSEHFHH